MSNAVDGTERWWQSPPLSRGLEYNEVNVTLDLGQVESLSPSAACPLCPWPKGSPWGEDQKVRCPPRMSLGGWAEAGHRRAAGGRPIQTEAWHWAPSVCFLSILVVHRERGAPDGGLTRGHVES